MDTNRTRVAHWLCVCRTWHTLTKASLNLSFHFYHKMDSFLKAIITDYIQLGVSQQQQFACSGFCIKRSKSPGELPLPPLPDLKTPGNSLTTACITLISSSLKMSLCPSVKPSCYDTAWVGTFILVLKEIQWTEFHIYTVEFKLHTHTYRVKASLHSHIKLNKKWVRGSWLFHLWLTLCNMQARYLKKERVGRHLQV